MDDYIIIFFNSFLVTTENGKPVRRRFLDACMIAPTSLELLETRIASASLTYRNWLEKYVQQMVRDQKNLHSQFKTFFLRLRWVQLSMFSVSQAQASTQLASQHELVSSWAKATTAFRILCVLKYSQNCQNLNLTKTQPNITIFLDQK